MGVFGDLVTLNVALDRDDNEGEVWRAHVPRLVKEVGKGLLSLESVSLLRLAPSPALRES